jgi:hypothetical protein
MADINPDSVITPKSSTAAARYLTPRFFDLDTTVPYLLTWMRPKWIGKPLVSIAASHFR